MDSKRKRIVILGGGFAGLRFLYDVNRDLGDTVDVTLIDERSTSLEKPSLPEVALSGKDVSLVQIKFESIVKGENLHFLNQSAVNIDAEKNKVTMGDGSSLEYDYLVIATGAVKDYDAVSGYRSYGYSVCDDVEAPKLWEALKNFKGGKIVIGSAKTEWDPETTDIRLAAPCEGPIGEIMFMIDYYLRQHGLREKSTITVFSPGEIFFEDVGENVHSKIGPLIKNHEINVFTKKILVEITEKGVKFEDGTSMDSDLSIIIPPYSGTDIIKKSKLGDGFGFIRTNNEMRVPEFSNIFVVGDTNANSMPKLGHIATMQADVAASSLVRELTGRGDVKELRPEIFCIMNRGGSDATLILSDAIFGGKTDLTIDGPVAHTMKIGFDSYYYYTRGHMPPEFLQSSLEKFLKSLK
ncbi:MAG: FAD-dependent oxidoreductase [Thermoplasmataceae archaeon]